jgi:hypothetical protein
MEPRINLLFECGFRIRHIFEDEGGRIAFTTGADIYKYDHDFCIKRLKDIDYLPVFISGHIPTFVPDSEPPLLTLSQGRVVQLPKTAQEYYGA